MAGKGLSRVRWRQAASIVAAFGVVEPALDVLAGRTLRVARRQAVDVDRPLGAPGAGLVGQRRAGVERDGEGLLHRHAVTSSSSLKRRMLRSASAWMRRQHLGLAGAGEEMREALLRPQVRFDRHAVADLRHRRDFAMLGFEDREDAGLARQPRQLDRVLAGRAPAQRAWHQDVQVARAVQGHRRLDLFLKVAQVSHGGGGDVGNLVRHGDPRQVLALAECRARRRADRHRGRRARRRRRGRAALHAGVHVGLVVVTDVEHVVVALEQARQTAEADVGGAAVAALGDDAHGAALESGPDGLDLQRGRDAGAHRRRVAKERVDPGQLPARLGVGRRKHLQAAGGVGGDQLSFRGAHRGVDRITRAQRLAAALAGAVARVERVVAVDAGLHAALLGCEQAVADGEGAGLVELERLVHVMPPWKPRCRHHAAGSRRSGRCDAPAPRVRAGG